MPSVNYIDETSWFCTHTLHWLWVMASERVAFYMIHPHRVQRSLRSPHRRLGRHPGQ